MMLDQLMMWLQVGHSNHKQKIQHHVAVKKENAELKQTVQRLTSSINTAERRVKRSYSFDKLIGESDWLSCRYEEELAKVHGDAGDLAKATIDFDKEEALMESLQVMKITFVPQLRQLICRRNGYRI